MSVTIISVVAGPIEGNGPRHGDHHQLKMDNVFFSITPETARQWLPIITEIAEDEHG